MQKKRTPPTQVGFRLNEEAARLLFEEAQGRGVSSHELARWVLLHWLTDQERHRLRRALSSLRKEVLKQRADLKQAVIAILCDAGKVERQDAEDWVNRHLFK